MHPKNISIADYSYTLPEERIAHHPLTERDASKLLIYRDGQIREDRYRHLAGHLPENSLLVFNNTKVIEARLVFLKPSGGKIEIFCLEPAPGTPNGTAAMLQTGRVQWKCLIGGASKWKPGQVLRKEVGPSGTGAVGAKEPHTILEARWLDKLEDGFLIELSWSPPDLSFAELLHLAGHIPLPPYIRRPAEAADSQRYQTVYARHDGSVAAPTAGLHFTPAIFEDLKEKNIRQEFVTLHVGAGTFMPVKSPLLGQHVMHSEFISVEQTVIRGLLQQLEQGSGMIVPVGTTSLRTIESLYWLGVKTIHDPAVTPEELFVEQWDPYAVEPYEDTAGSTMAAQDIPPRQALQTLLDWMGRQGLAQFFTRTQLLITPGYEWKISKGLITNFHQPGSTLLLLVAALIGEDWKNVYQYALEHDFRFLSYGDGSLLFPPSAAFSRAVPG